MRTPARSGAVLPVVVLLMVGMTLLAHTAYILALGQLQVAEVGRDILQASLAAEAGLDAVAREPALQASLLDSLLVVRRAWGYRTSLTLTARPLTREIAWLVAEGETRRLPVPVRLGQLVWTLDAIERVARTAAAASSRSVATTAVTVDEWWSVPQGADTLACTGLIQELFFRGATIPPAVGLSPAAVAVGQISLPALEAFATAGVSGVVTPKPTENKGVCSTGLSLNWGDTSSPSEPCASHRPLIWSGGDLQVVGGSGQGILAVSGHLTFSAAAHFRGLVLASGDVRIETGSRVEGVIKSGGAITSDSQGTLVGSACATWAALAARPALRFAIPLEPGRRLVLP